MSGLKRLWTQMRFVEAFEGMDDPMASSMSSLKKRIENLEHGLDRLERQLHSRAEGGENGGRDRDRTCDPYHVKVVLSR